LRIETTVYCRRLQLPEEMLRYFRSEWLPNTAGLDSYHRIIEILRSRLSPVLHEQHAIYISARRRAAGVKPRAQRRSGKVLRL
jgi:hypothetical protein